MVPGVEGSSPFTHPICKSRGSSIESRRPRFFLRLPSFIDLLGVGPLAQLVEQLTLNQRVRSSSLRRPTIFSNVSVNHRYHEAVCGRVASLLRAVPLLGSIFLPGEQQMAIRPDGMPSGFDLAGAAGCRSQNRTELLRSCSRRGLGFGIFKGWRLELCVDVRRGCRS